MKREKTDYAILAVTNALDLLEQFGGERDEFSVTELSRRLKLHKNNVFRLLATLEARDYIEQNRLTGNYGLGLGSLELAQTFVRQADLKSRARPILEEVASSSNETSQLLVLKQASVICLDAVETTHVVRIAPRIGSRSPAVCTAAGKVHLAYLTESALESALSSEAATGTFSDTHAVGTYPPPGLHEVARRGYALDLEEYEEGVRCVAAPIRNHTGEVAGAISLSGPTQRFSGERLEQELIPLCLQAAEDISIRLGYCAEEHQ
jgi:IclR family KDG regulon transcriptional repressor